MKYRKSTFFLLFVFISIFAVNNYSQATNGLVAYFPFNGNVNDESGNGNNGAVFSATLTEDRFGNPNSAYSFDGAGNYIGYPSLWSSAPDSITFAAWFNVMDSLEDGKILYHGDNGEFQIFIGGDSAWAGVHLGQNVTDPWYYVNVVTFQNEWYMIAAIWVKGESFRLYLNGELVDSVGVSPDGLLDPGPTYQPSIGSYGRNLGAYFDGEIDDIRIYNRALTGVEIDSLFKEGTTSVEEISSTIPNEFKLFQNYPNPFNPTTNIQFSLPQSSFVKLEVFNTIGERVNVLVFEELNVGSYNYDWNASNLTSGVYFYQLKAGDFVETKKMILLK
jgi:hypothetical protein